MKRSDRNRPISYVLANTPDDEGDVTFNIAVFLEQLVWQTFCPFVVPLAIMIRGKYWALNSGMLPRSLKPADFIKWIGTGLLLPRGLAYFSAIYILYSSSGSASLLYTLVDLVHLAFGFCFWNCSIAIRYAYMHPAAYRRYFTQQLSQEEIVGSLIAATWDDLKPDVVERETNSLLDECSDFLDECILHSKFEFTEQSMALIASSLCDEAKNMLFLTDEADDSSTVVSNGSVFVDSIRFAKTIILQSNHLTTQGCGGGAHFPTPFGTAPAVKYSMWARITYCFLVAISGILIRAVVGQPPLGTSSAEAVAIVLIALTTMFMSTPVAWFSFSNIAHHTRLDISLIMLARMTDAKISVHGNIAKAVHAVRGAIRMQKLSGVSSLPVPETLESPTRHSRNQVQPEWLHTFTPPVQPLDMETLENRPPGEVPAQQHQAPLDSMVDCSSISVRIVKLKTVDDISAFLMCRHVLRWFGRRFQARLIANCAVCATPETQLSLASATK